MSNAYLKFMQRRHAKALEKANGGKEWLKRQLELMLKGADSATAALNAGNNVKAQVELDFCKEIFTLAVTRAVEPAFRVYVRPAPASNGLTYFVVLERTDREEGDLPTEGYVSVINRHDVTEANTEGYLWAGFLGVPFTPCEPIIDSATRKSVMEGGTMQMPIEAAHLLKNDLWSRVLEHFDMFESKPGELPYIPIVLTMFEAHGKAYAIEVDGVPAVMDIKLDRGVQYCYLRENESIRFDGGQHLELQGGDLFFKDHEGRRHKVRFSFTYQPKVPKRET